MGSFLIGLIIVICVVGYWVIGTAVYRATDPKGYMNWGVSGWASFLSIMGAWGIGMLYFINTTTSFESHPTDNHWSTACIWWIILGIPWLIGAIASALICEKNDRVLSGIFWPVALVLRLLILVVAIFVVPAFEWVAKIVAGTASQAAKGPTAWGNYIGDYVKGMKNG